MNDLLSSLKVSEIKLIIGAVIALFLLLVTLFFLNLYKEYNQSIKNLNKEKMDYEYVISKANSLSKISKPKFINFKIIEEIIINNNAYKNITNLSVNIDSNKALVTFSSSDISTSMLLSENIANASSMDIQSIESISQENIINISITLIQSL